MRFTYNQDNGYLSAYVKKKDFELILNNNEYQVYNKKIERENFNDFIKNYSNFIKEFFSSVSPDEQVQQIISISNFKQGFTWRSLLDLHYGGEKICFLENMFSYILYEIQNNIKQNTLILSPEDAARLQLISALMYMPGLPQPFKKNQKYKGVKVLLQKKIEIFDKKLISYENKYKISSDIFFKKYKDIDNNEKYIKEWLKLYEQREDLKRTLSQQDLVNKFVKLWIKNN